MDVIAEQAEAAKTEELTFTTPESARCQPLRRTDEIEAFQRSVAALDCWPLEDPIDAWSLRLMTSQATYGAQTAYLRRLASF